MLNFHQNLPQPYDLIRQRLQLYGFCYLEVDPFSTGLPDWVSPHIGLYSHSSKWNAFLWFLPKASLFNGFPLCSNSMRLLLRIRHHQPKRPLIFVRTLFEPIPSFNQLKKLLISTKTPFNTIRACLDPEDPFLPLRWMKSFWLHSPLDQVAPFLQMRHPLHLLGKALKNHNPQAHVDHLENGLISIQPSLFHAFQPIKRPQPYFRDLEVRDRGIRVFLNEGITRFVVLAQRASTLAWFDKDITRLGSSRTHTLNFPCLPNPWDKQTFFVKVLDRDIQFCTLPKGFSILHLDGTLRHFLYRRYRTLEKGSVAFRISGQFQEVGGPFLQIGKQKMWLSLRGEKWILARSKPSQPAHSRDFLDFYQLHHYLQGRTSSSPP